MRQYLFTSICILDGKYQLIRAHNILKKLILGGKVEGVRSRRKTKETIGGGLDGECLERGQ